jgi:signal transduction histidine kinase
MAGEDDAAQVALADLTALLAACRRVTGLLDEAVLAQRASAEARKLVTAELSALALVDDPTLLVMRGTSGIRSPAIGQLRIPRGTGLGGRILLERRPIAVSDYAHDQEISRELVDVVADEEGIRALVGVPIEHDDQVLGILYAGLRTAGSLGTRGEAMLLEFARSLGPQLQSTRQVELARQLSVQEERHRIALELHDTVGQLLFGIGVAARRAQASFSDSTQTGAVDLLKDLKSIEEGASRTAAELRAALRALAPATPHEGLATMVRMDAAAFSDRTGVPAHFVVVGEPIELAPAVQAVLVAVVREGLHNVEKHARASSVILTLYYTENDAGIVIQDDGVGLQVDLAFEPVPRSGHQMGLASLLHRTQRLGGTLVALANEDGGTTLRASIPVRFAPP